MIDRRTMLGAAAALGAMPLAARASPKSPNRFPKGFLWGASTSGHQIEGNNVNSDAWALENVKPTIYAEPSGDAANSFELWPQDLDLVQRLGLGCYRFSLEWSRIEPERGQFSIAMLDHYKAMIAGCRSRGLIPFVTFNHYTTPRWVATLGGWTNPEMPKFFSDFCDRAARHLADGIGYAMTLNEPNLILVIRNGLAPGVWQQSLRAPAPGAWQVFASSDGRDGSLVVEQDLCIARGLAAEGCNVMINGFAGPGHAEERRRTDHRRDLVWRGRAAIDPGRVRPGRVELRKKCSNGFAYKQRIGTMDKCNHHHVPSFDRRGSRTHLCRVYRSLEPAFAGGRLHSAGTARVGRLP